MKYILILALIVTAFHLSAKEYTLDEIFKIVNINSLTVKQLELMSASIKNQLEMQGSDLMDTSIGYGLNNLTPKDGNIDINMLAHRFFIKQQIPLSGKLYYEKKAAYYDYINSIEETNMKKLELKKMILNNITDWHLLKEVENNKVKEAALLKNLKEIVKSQFSTGQALISNITQVDIKIAQSQTMLNDTRSMEKLLENEIIDILDVSDDSFGLQELMFSHDIIDVSKINSNDLYEKAIKFNPSLKISSNQVLKMESLKAASISELVPNIELMAEYMLKPNPMIENSFSFQAELNIPIFSAYSKANKIEMFKKQQEQAKYQKLDTENNLKNYLKRKVIELDNNVTQSTILYKNIIEPSKDNINSILQAYQVNKMSIDSVIDSILSIYDLENQYFVYLGKIYKILYEIESLTGEKLYNL